MRLYGELLRHQGEPPVACRRVESLEELLKESDVRGSSGHTCGKFLCMVTSRTWENLQNVA